MNAVYWAIITTFRGIGELELLLLAIPATAVIVLIVRRDRRQRATRE